MNQINFEVQNNLLINSLRHNKTYNDLVEMIAKQSAILMVPNSKALETMIFTRDFIESHILLVNPLDHTLFVTANGITGRFTKKNQTTYLEILAKPPSKQEKKLFRSVQKKKFNPFFLDKERFQKNPIPEIKNPSVIDKNKIYLSEKLPQCMLAILSHPIEYPGCSWKNTESEKQNNLNFPVEVGDSDSKNKKIRHRKSHGRKREKSTNQKTAIGNAHQMEVFLSQFPESDLSRDVSLSINIFYEKNLTSGQAGKMMNNILGSLAERYLDKRIFATKNNEAEDIWQSEIGEYYELKQQQVEFVYEILEEYFTAHLYDYLYILNHKHVEMNDMLHTRCLVLSFVSEKHLKIFSKISDFSKIIQMSEKIQNMDNHQTPKGKLSCVCECCSLALQILGGIENPPETNDVDQLLAYSILKASPPHLYSNIKFISHYRNPKILSFTEEGASFRMFLSGFHFFQNLKSEDLEIDKQEYFEKLQKKEKEIETQKQKEIEDRKRKKMEKKANEIKRILSQEDPLDPSERYKRRELQENLFPFMNVKSTKQFSIKEMKMLFKEYQKMFFQFTQLRDTFQNKKEIKENLD